MTHEQRVTLVTAAAREDFKPLEPFGIPAMAQVDAAAGLRGERGVTAFPLPFALAATFDTRLAERYGQAIGAEARAKVWNVLLGLVVDIDRDPRAGRAAESFGEDPLVKGAMGAAVARGFQHNDVIAQVKHFTAYNQETDRFSLAIRVSERALREVHYPAFEQTIREGGALSVMGSYPKVNGVLVGPQADADRPGPAWRPRTGGALRLDRRRHADSHRSRSRPGGARRAVLRPVRPCHRGGGPMSEGMRRVPRKSIALAALAAAACAAGLPGVVTAQPSPEKAPDTITWGKCDRPDIQKGVQCGTLRVPVDWAKPQSGTVALRAYRFKAVGPSKSKGTILNFPSGPGETGDIAFASLREHLPGYDLIALDPRGVGASGPLNCATDKILKIPYVPPTDRRKFRALRRNQRSFWPTCTTTPAGLKSHLDAYSNARDAEALRKAMHLDRINLYGFSYGTLSAERYLGLYGEHVNGSVLEGVMNPAQSRRQFVTSAARGMEAIFDRFRKWCAEEAACALHGKDVASVFRKAQKKADDGHIPGSLITTPWSSVAVTRYFELTAPNSFKDTADGLKKLSEGKNPMPDDEETDKGPMPKTFPYTDPIVCSDFDLSVKNVDQARRDLKATWKAAPVLGFSTNSNNYTSICLAGPHPAKGSSKFVTSRSDRPTMLLSNTLDPATPITWANSVARQLGHQAITVRTDQVGHGGGLDNPKTQRKVVTYLDHASRTGR